MALALPFWTGSCALHHLTRDELKVRVSYYPNFDLGKLEGWDVKVPTQSA